MIKFWKSAAKGKTGCPVRPPEQNCKSASSIDTKSLLVTQLDEENQDCSHIFEKKSKLSPNLHDILREKKTIKYFVQFMESIKQHLLIKCWLELEHFKLLTLNILKNDVNNHLKVNRTRSLEFHSNSIKTDNRQLTSNEKQSDTSSATNISMFNENECSSGSYTNIDQYYSSCKDINVLTNRSTTVTEEAVSLFKIYVALEAPQKLQLPDNVRKTIISNICQPEGQIQADCFQPVQDILFSDMEIKYFKDFQHSPFYIKAQIDILTSGTLDLNDILYNETILFYFTEYLEQEACSMLLEFLISVTYFRDNLMSANAPDSEQAQADAIILYDKYFSLQATNPIGFPTNIRLQVESDICREGGPLATCFDTSYQIVFKTLTSCVKTFLDCDLYYKYLSEMIHSVDQIWSTNHKSHSDCSSEFSISTHNTLLAMGDPIFQKKRRNLSVPDMTIDSNQLYNADALWQRKRYEGLTLGRVNSLGRFESKFEPDPDKKGKSVLRKMVSRFVPTNTSKVEEEMAWQVAHMIVKDITDLTMAPPDNEGDEL